MSFEKRKPRLSLVSATINFPGFAKLPLEAREEFMKLLKRKLKEDGHMLKYGMEQGEIVLTIIVPQEAK